MPTVALLWVLVFAGHLSAAEGDEFFESRIRPVLVERCYSCHSTQAKMAMGGLRLDTAEALRKGGDSGPSIVPGDPSRSRLIEAVRYSSLRLKMPPSGKLTDAQIADFERWVAMGAPDPRTPPATAATAPKPSAAGTMDLAAARRFWSLQPTARPTLPTVRNSAWVRSPIDAFLLSKLEQKGLQPAAAATPRAWIRRVTFDLTGLPPTPQEIDDYLADKSTEADRRVVERLLASPHYGERWARHWLDLVRFAETNGHEFDNEKLDSWRYRDYIIRAFNQDLPYDQLVKEHVAGDLLANPRLSLDGTHYESPLGTGAFWFGEILNSATDSVKSRADMVDNQLDVFGKTFLGLTVACARCHDHKFDPIPTADYYALAGVMHSTYVREAVIDSPKRQSEIEAAHRRVAEINARIRALVPDTDTPQPKPLALREGDVVFEDFNDGYEGWTAAGAAFGQRPTRQIAPNQPIANFAGEALASSFGAGTDRLVGSLTSRKFKMPKLWVHVRLAGTKGDRYIKEREQLRVTVVADDHKSEHFVSKGTPGLHWVTIRMTKEIGRTCYFEFVDRSTSGHIAVDTILFSDHDKPPADADAPLPGGPATLEDRIPSPGRSELAELRRQRAAAEAAIPPSAFAMISMEEDPHNVKLHIRGSHQNLGAEVPRAFLRVLSKGDQAEPFRQGSGRLELAEAIASPTNPLTTRVMVNRVWKHHFGQGLVHSLDNFGKMGELPSHPELLDWLAVRFIESKWSIKELHRLITLSSAYRMSATTSARAMEADPRNSLLHHMPVRRLEAEAIRDTMLSISGMLQPALYGPSVVPHISKYQDGRGKPKSGPLDGEGRRSIYIQVRRNFIPPMFLAFDYPLPVSAIGARGVSTVPSQALLMLNNEFVAAAASAWARQTIRDENVPERRVQRLYAQAFGRPPEDWEQRDTLSFIAAAKAQDEQRAWTDLCHVLLNSAEFLYVQ
jgi:cytochrome c553